MSKCWNENFVKIIPKTKIKIIEIINLIYLGRNWISKFLLEENFSFFIRASYWSLCKYKLEIK